MSSKHLPTPELNEAKAARQLQQKLLTPREVAGWLDVSVDWVQDHATHKQPKIPAIRLGKLLRFRRGDVEEFIQAQVQRRPQAFAADLTLTVPGQRSRAAGRMD